MYPQDEYPRVTQVLQSVGLIDYGPYAHRAEALDRGAQAHAAIAYDLRGELDEDSARDAGVWGYVVAARAALDALGITRADCDLIEHSRAHDLLRYRGTIDLVSRDRDLVIDWKTGKAEFWVRFQLAAYAGLLAPYGAGIRRVAAELHDDGSYTLYEIPTTDWREDYDTFLAALRVHHEKTNPRKL